MAHGAYCPDMTWLRKAAVIALISAALTACAPPAIPAGPTPPSRGADTRTLFLPSIARRASPASQFLPRVARHVDSRQFFPSVTKNYPMCAVYGSDCAEPNGTRAQAAVLAELNRPFFGTVFTATADAYDYFIVTLVMNKRYTMTLAGGPAPGSAFAGQNDADLYLYDATTPPVASSAGYGNVAETISFVAPASGNYFLLAYAFHTPASPAPYRLEVSDRP